MKLGNESGTQNRVPFQQNRTGVSFNRGHDDVVLQRRIMKRFDVDGDGTVDFDEFKQLLAKLMARGSPPPSDCVCLDVDPALVLK